MAGTGGFERGKAEVRGLGWRLFRGVALGQAVDEADGFEADADDLADEADDVLGVVRAVGVAVDAAALVGVTGTASGATRRGGL